jgi:hypothetical protein
LNGTAFSAMSEKAMSSAMPSLPASAAGTPSASRLICVTASRCRAASALKSCSPAEAPSSNGANAAAMRPTSTLAR